MDKFIIRPHSIVDIITNSSTVIYTGVTDNAVEAVKGIINDVLQSVGSDYTADNLYIIESVDREELYKQELDKIDEEAYGSQEEFWMAEENLRDEVYSRFDNQVSLDFADSGTRAGANIMVTSSAGGSKKISDLLAKIFLVREDYG